MIGEGLSNFRAVELYFFGYWWAHIIHLSESIGRQGQNECKCNLWTFTDKDVLM